VKWILALMVTCIAALVSPFAQATISRGDDAELMLVLWDPVQKVSYTKDLGLNTYHGADAQLNRNSFFVYAQQDSGYQQFWSLDTSTDANYQKFRSVATDVANTAWAVIAVDALGNPSDPPGSIRVFTTLKSGQLAGVENPAYTKLKSLNNDDFNQQALFFSGDYIDSLNVATGNPLFNTHRPATGEDFAVNGSSYDVDGTPGYFGKNAGANGTFGPSCNCSLMNQVGKSSWFYYATTSTEIDGTLPVAIDEFDNLGHDGYFGLAQDPSNGKYVLSYTLQSALASASAVTAEGKARASLTELRSGSVTRLISAPANEFLAWCAPVSAVPEADAWWSLVAGGLAMAAVRCRQRRKGDCSAAPTR